MKIGSNRDSTKRQSLVDEFSMPGKVVLEDDQDSIGPWLYTRNKLQLSSNFHLNGIVVSTDERELPNLTCDHPAAT